MIERSKRRFMRLVRRILRCDFGEKVVVSDSSTTLPYGRAATNINDLRNGVAAFARTWGFLTRIKY